MSLEVGPAAQRLLMVGLAIGCFVAAAHFGGECLALVPLGTYLIGWAQKAPGHDGGPTPPTGPTGLMTLGFAALLLGACANPPPLPKLSPAERLQLEALALGQVCGSALASREPLPAELEELCKHVVKPPAFESAGAGSQ